MYIIGLERAKAAQQRQPAWEFPDRVSGLVMRYKAQVRLAFCNPNNDESS